jgi:hypothetical protein
VVWEDGSREAPSYPILFARSSVRGEKALPLPTIPLSAGRVRLLIELDDKDYVNYQVILKTVGGREILRRRAGKVRFGKDLAFATLPVKAGELTKGDYILTLFGQTSDGRSEEIDRYLFRVP